jgi:hypothetical protein
MLPRALPRALRAISTSNALRTTTPARNGIRFLSSTQQTRAATSHDDHHESPYDPPGGWLWGVPPGEKRQREGWEIPFFTMYCGGTVVAVICYSMKEDTT